MEVWIVVGIFWVVSIWATYSVAHAVGERDVWREVIIMREEWL